MIAVAIVGLVVVVSDDDRVTETSASPAGDGGEPAMTEGTLVVDSDLTIKEFDILAYVGAFGPIRPVDLAKRTALTGSPQTLSSALNRLEQRDLVLRSPNEDDVRGVEGSITNQGLEQLQTLFPVLSKKLIEPFDIHYSDEELAELDRLLQRL